LYAQSPLGYPHPAQKKTLMVFFIKSYFIGFYEGLKILKNDFYEILVIFMKKRKQRLY